MEEKAWVVCASCGSPGRVTFENNVITKAVFTCKCPRPMYAGLGQAQK